MHTLIYIYIYIYIYISVVLWQLMPDTLMHILPKSVSCQNHQGDKQECTLFS